jgi:hypothetical protein
MSEVATDGGSAASTAPAGDVQVESAEVTQPVETAEESATEESDTPAAEEVTEESEEPKEEKPARKSAKEWAKETLERDFDDDEQADEFVRDFAAKSQTLNKQLLNWFTKEPDVADIVSKTVKGGDSFWEVMAEYLTPEEYADLIDSTEKGKENRANRLAKIEADKKMAEAIKVNTAKSEKALVAFMEENNMDEKATGEFFDKTVLPIVKRLVSQDFDKEFFDMLLKSHNYKNAIKEASEVAEIKGRNAKIVTEKEKTPADGLPKITGGGMGKPAEEVAQKQMSSIARVAAQSEAEQKRIK